MQTSALTISQLVRADYRLADVFRKWGINYCCGGQLTLDEVCALQGLQKHQLEADIQQAQQALHNAYVSYANWPLDFLADYIIHVHHAYLKSSIPALRRAIETFAAGHEKQYPPISRVYEAFKKLASVLNEQMLLEEGLLFPYIRQVSQAAKRTESYGPLFVRTLQKPIGATTEKWQAQTVLLLVDLRTAANQYAFPEKACTNHQVIYHKLAHFDADLVRHKYLEHNFLYPNAAQLELELLQL